MSQFVQSDISGWRPRRVFDQIDHSRQSLANLALPPTRCAGGASWPRCSRGTGSTTRDGWPAPAGVGAASMAEQVAQMKDRVAPS